MILGLWAHLLELTRGWAAQPNRGESRAREGKAEARALRASPNELAAANMGAEHDSHAPALRARPLNCGPGRRFQEAGQPPVEALAKPRRGYDVADCKGMRYHSLLYIGNLLDGSDLFFTPRLPGIKLKGGRANLVAGVKTVHGFSPECGTSVTTFRFGYMILPTNVWLVRLPGSRGSMRIEVSPA